MGDVSVENYPGHYVRCFEELWNAYLKESFEKKRPLIVNTMGWIKG